METIEAIHTRRSIRKYKDKPVSEDLIKELLKAGMAAPSARNEQSWQFIVITDKEILKKIPEVNPHAAMAAQAPAAILVCGDSSKDYWIQDCSAAIQNILLAAHANGLGAVWTGIYPKEDRVEGYRELLGIPENIISVALIPIGYPDEEKPKEDRYTEEKVHYNKW